MSARAERRRPPFPPQHQQAPGLERDIHPRPLYRAPDYQPANKLAGKRALITGGDSGIGRAVALIFAREGADVAFVHLPIEDPDARTTVAEIEKEGRRALAIAGDVTDPDFCREAVERTVAELGGLDILVNNAARQKHIDDIADLALEDWDRTFDTNIRAYFLFAKAALDHLPDGGAIINTGSITGLEGSRALLDYSATKGAIHAFTKSLAQQLVDRRIRVNCVAPGPVWTPLNPSDRDAKATSKFGEDTPYGRPAQPEEIAPAYVFFASEADSSFITGEVMTLLGGETRSA